MTVITENLFLELTGGDRRIFLEKAQPIPPVSEKTPCQNLFSTKSSWGCPGFVWGVFGVMTLDRLELGRDRPLTVDEGGLDEC